MDPNCATNYLLVLDALAAANSNDEALCPFRTALYNVIPEGTVRQRPEYCDRDPRNAIELLLQQAELNNPDPAKYAPVLVFGFEHLKKRLEAQSTMVAQHNAVLDQLATKVAGLDVSKAALLQKLYDCTQIQLALKQRFLALMKRIEVWRMRGQPITGAEESLRQHVDSLQRELDKPTQFKAKLHELSCLVAMQAETTADAYEVVDEEAMRKVYAFLREQSRGLDHLSEVLRRDLRDLDIIRQAHRRH